MRTNKAICAIVTTAAALCANTAHSQNFPSQPIRIVVPFSPGGGTDTLSRIVAQHLSIELKQPVAIENKPGAGGTLGGALVAKAPADGYTLYVASTATAMTPALYKDLSYEPIKDFAPVALIGTTPFILVMNKNVPAVSLGEMIALAKAKPGGLSYGSAGFASVNHVGMELFNSMAGVDIMHVPYKGSSAAMVDVIGGRVSMMMDTIGSATQHIKSGNNLRALAATSSKRSTLAPDLPTVSELGPNGYELTVWYGLVAPKGTPEPVLRILNAGVNKVLANPDLRERYTSLGTEPVSSTLESFAALMTSEEKKWSDVIVGAGIKTQ